MWWRAHKLRCRTVARVVQAYLDGELLDTRAILIAEHLDRCLRCGLDAQTWRWLKVALSGLAEPDDAERLQRLQAFVEELADPA